MGLVNFSCEYPESARNQFITAEGSSNHSIGTCVKILTTINSKNAFGIY